MSKTPGIFALTLLAGATLMLTLTTAQAQVQAQGTTQRYIIGAKAGKIATMRSAVTAARGSIRREIDADEAISADLSAEAVESLKRHADVDYVEEDVKRYALALTAASAGQTYAPGQLVPYGIPMVQADKLAGTNASSRKLCIIDSGYDANHEDLSGRGNVNGEYDAGTGWWYTDENQHGTHVAGTISALNNAGTGVVGVSANRTLRLHIVKVFDAAGWAYSSTLAAAARKCHQAGSNIISMSLGGDTPSRTEQRTFDRLYRQGVLSIAAAGNAGDASLLYPAAYASVVSVAAVDETMAHASFSQFNADVELAAPGVSVLSTVPMGTGREATLSAANVAYAPIPMTGTPAGAVSAPLADFGLGGAAVAGSMSGKICLIQRGTYDFATKVSNCEASGGLGAVVYNNVAGAFGGTLGTAVTSIPSVSVSGTEGAALFALLGQAATLNVTATSYAYFNGTSMATPHVSAVAAIVWARNPNCTAAQLRESLNRSALDLGDRGRDVYFGHGLVQARAADQRIKARGCGR